ncbi:hypothetical protein EJ04DRAFT_540192 [Polyplosphaeria fusca]|uniref:Uncharacterized protein n=1 Tax=Polyplosphaeria fusca TaxID=682080 RepID=A0A9P4RBN5_9PLEO|nr:hypothetical protein EJ04DRAFT_540192 [Polyplosphaeria fusca]
MANLLGIEYESSDEESADQPQICLSSTAAAPPSEFAPNPTGSPEAQSIPPSGPLLGPAQGPSTFSDDISDGAAPGSPYTSMRSAIQNLTLPMVPNFDIPPSPPGSPPLEATNKFATFLERKSKGQHFNQLLGERPALRGPGHLKSLMEFAEITESEQYQSTLPEEVAVPTVYPEWAYVERLNESRRKISKEEEDKRRGKREKIEFVSATSAAGKLSN